MLDALRFLKKVFIGVVKMIIAVIFVGAGAVALALVIHQVYTTLEAQKLGLPPWAHQSEVQGTGLVFVTLIVLTVIIVLKDTWRVGVREEREEEEHDDSA